MSTLPIIMASTLLVLADPALSLGRPRLADFAARNRLRSMHALKEDAEAGGLMSYGADAPDLRSY